MPQCKKHCICKCDKLGCECWDGLAIVRMAETIAKEATK